MTDEKFLELLQALLTMVDSSDPLSIANVKNALNSFYALAVSSQKVNVKTRMMMRSATMQADHLIAHHKNYAGKPGDYAENLSKRRMLEHLLVPHC